jgi:hypothetical protein
MNTSQVLFTNYHLRTAGVKPLTRGFPTVEIQPAHRMARRRKALVHAKALNLEAILGVVALFAAYAVAVMILLSNTRHPVRMLSLEAPGSKSHADKFRPDSNSLDVSSESAAMVKAPPEIEKHASPSDEEHELQTSKRSIRYGVIVAGANPLTFPSSANTYAKPSTRVEENLQLITPKVDETTHYGMRSMD